jgi:hypothetical protein
MSVPGSQHELAVMLINVNACMVYHVAAQCGIRLPAHDRMEASPVSHQMRGKSRISNDVTIRLYRGEQVVYFLQFEVQRDYSWDKFATLRAYHGSEVRNSGCGGHMIVLSPERNVAERFSRADPVLEEFLSPDLMERIKEMPAFRARFDQARAEGEAKGELTGEARGEAKGEGESLLRYFRVRGDDLAPHVLEQIRACTDPALLADWQERAYRGETSEQIFGGK